MTSNIAFTHTEMLELLPVVLSDLKHHQNPGRRLRYNANIRRDLYQAVIRELYSDTRFAHREAVEENGRVCGEGLFIKGYVRDVWAYLEEAYDLIHDTDFERDFHDLIEKVV